LAYNTQPHAATKVAPLELVNPFGVASWSIKDLTRKSHPATAQRGPHAEKKEQVAFLTRIVRLIPRIREAFTAAQHRYKRNHDSRIRPQPTGLEVGRFVFKQHLDYKGSKLGHRAQGPSRVVRIEGPTAVLDIKGEHLRENIVHLVRAPSGPAAEPPLHPALDATVRPHGPSLDGHTYHIDQILDHADGEDGRLLVKVTWTGYEDATWEDASVAPHETQRMYLRRASRPGLFHTAEDRPPGVTEDNVAAAAADAALAPSVGGTPENPAATDPPSGAHIRGRVAGGAPPPQCWCTDRDGGRVAGGTTPPRFWCTCRGGGRVAGGTTPPRCRCTGRGGGRVAGGGDPRAVLGHRSKRRARRRWGDSPAGLLHRSWRRAPRRLGTPRSWRPPLRGGRVAGGATAPRCCRTGRGGGRITSGATPARC